MTEQGLDSEDDGYLYPTITVAAQSEGISLMTMSKLIRDHGMPTHLIPGSKGRARQVSRSVLRDYISKYVGRAGAKAKVVTFSERPSLDSEFFGDDQDDLGEGPPGPGLDFEEEEALDSPQGASKALRSVGRSSSETDLYRDLEFSRAVVRAVFRKFRLLDPSESAVNARMFGQYAEILSKGMSRVMTLEERILKIQEKRGELLDFDTVSKIVRDTTVLILRGLEDFSLESVDIFKRAEFEAYKESKIDSEELMDRLKLALEDMRTRVARDLRKVDTPRDTELSGIEVVKAMREVPGDFEEDEEDSDDDDND